MDSNMVLYRGVHVIVWPTSHSEDFVNMLP